MAKFSPPVLSKDQPVEFQMMDIIMIQQAFERAIKSELPKTTIASRNIITWLGQYFTTIVQNKLINFKSPPLSRNTINAKRVLARQNSTKRLRIKTLTSTGRTGKNNLTNRPLRMTDMYLDSIGLTDSKNPDRIITGKTSRQDTAITRTGKKKTQVLYNVSINKGNELYYINPYQLPSDPKKYKYGGRKISLLQVAAMHEFGTVNEPARPIWGPAYLEARAFLQSIPANRLAKVGIGSSKNLFDIMADELFYGTDLSSKTSGRSGNWLREYKTRLAKATKGVDVSGKSAEAYKTYSDRSVNRFGFRNIDTKQVFNAKQVLIDDAVKYAKSSKFVIGLGAKLHQRLNFRTNSFLKHYIGR